MKTVRFEFAFQGYWAVRSGFGSGGLMDSVVVRTKAGLPHLPGRSVKGLFRHAVMLGEIAGAFQKDTTVRLFGSAVDAGESKRARTETAPGELYFSSAVLPDWEAWIASEPTDSSSLIGELFRNVASTAIGRDGQAAKGTLRVDEVTVPVTLVTEVKGPDEGEGANGWEMILDEACHLIREAGANRNRGLGRVRVTKKVK